MTETSSAAAAPEAPENAVLPLPRLLPPPPEGTILTPPEHKEPPPRAWFFVQLWAELRLAVKMYFDPRYRVSRTAQVAFPLFAILILVAMFTGMPTNNPQLYNYLSYAWLAFFAVIIFESIFLARVIGREVRARFPKTTMKMWTLKYYGIIRGLMFRKLRYPKPVVSAGEEY